MNINMNLENLLNIATTNIDRIELLIDDVNDDVIYGLEPTQKEIISDALKLLRDIKKNTKIKDITKECNERRFKYPFPCDAKRGCPYKYKCSHGLVNGKSVILYVE